MDVKKIQKTTAALRECVDAVNGMVKHLTGEVEALKKRLAPEPSGYRTVDKADDDMLAPAKSAEETLARLAKQARETPSLP